MRNQLGLVYHWLCTVIICMCISEHVQLVHFKLEKRNYQVQIFSLESNNTRNGVQIWLSRKRKIFNGHLQHWTEAETKSDSQVESLNNVAEFKANFMGKLYHY